MPRTRRAPPKSKPETAFSPGTVRDLARALAAKPYEPPDQTLPDALKNLTYDQYRSIRFLPEHALWRGEKRGFQAQFFHRGFYYKERIDIYEVADGRPRAVSYPTRRFSFGEGRSNGRRRRTRLRRLPPARADQPARLFRRSLRLPRRELFPRRRQGRDLRPLGARPRHRHRRAEGRGVSAVQGLLDRAAGARARPRSSCTPCSIPRASRGAYRFTDPARRDDDLRRRDGALSARRYRPRRARAAHQHVFLRPQRPSRLRRLPPRGARFRRPRRCSTATARSCGGRLHNPRDLQVSAFADAQSARLRACAAPARFLQLIRISNRFTRSARASWVEPIGDWGEGAVDAVRDPDQGGDPRQHRRLLAAQTDRSAAKASTPSPTACIGAPNAQAATRSRASSAPASAPGARRTRLFVLDIIGDRLKSVPTLKTSQGFQCTAKGQNPRHSHCSRNPETGGMARELPARRQGRPLVELRGN